MMAERRQTERISSGQAAVLCGYTAKTMRRLAEEGTIPGAAWLGNRWRFDQKKLLGWIRRQEVEPCQSKGPKTLSNGTVFGTPASKFTVVTCDAAYEQALGSKPKNGSRSC